MSGRVLVCSLLLACNPGTAPDGSPPPAPAPAAASPTRTWVVRLGGSDFDFVRPAGVGRDGETVALVSGSDDLTLETTAAPGAQRPAGEGVLLVRVGPRGELRAAHRLGHGLHANALVVADDGAVTIAGNYGVAMTLRGHEPRETVLGPLPLADAPARYPDAFLARVRPDGEVAWIRSFSGATHHDFEHLVGLPGGDVVVLGSFAGQGELEDGARGRTLSSLARTPDWDLVLARFAADGALQWTRVLDARGLDGARGLVALPGGDLAALGLCERPGLLATAAAPAPLACAAGQVTTFVAVYTPTGDLVRADAHPAGWLGDPSSFAALSDGGYAVAGRFAGTLGGDGLPALTSHGWPADPDVDGFLARFGPDGALAWRRHLRGSRSRGADRVVGDGDGGAWVWTAAELDLEVGDGRTYARPLANGGQNAALLHFDRAGILRAASLQGGKPDAQNLGDGAIDPEFGDVRVEAILRAPDGSLRLVGECSVDLRLDLAGEAHTLHIAREGARRGDLFHLDGFIAAHPGE
jgi:hypothetical protein